MKRRFYLIMAAVAAAVLGGTAWMVASPGEPKPARAQGDPVTEPLRAEHRELIPHIEALREAGDAVGAQSPEQQREKVHESYAFLTEHLIPHAVAEDKVLYVEVDRLIGKSGSTGATDTMRRDHTEVGALTGQLGELAEQMHKGDLSATQQRELRRVLYSLHGIVKLHFAKEEEVYLPLLDRELTAEEAQRMFERMAQVSGETGGTGHTD